MDDGHWEIYYGCSKNFTRGILSFNQFVGKERSECGLAKLMLKFVAKKYGLNKAILFDIKTTLDSLIRKLMKEKVKRKFINN